MYKILLPIIVATFILLPTQSSATSLFDESGCDLITSLRASDIGDLVTIVISESTNASNRSSTETEKSLNTDGELTVKGFLQWVAGLPPTISPIEDLTFTPTEEFEGEGKITSTANFKSRITATVVDVLPNGNLVIEGYRYIGIAEETAKLIIRGVIQERDLTADNTINSEQIAEMEILYEGEGIITERQHDGILSKIFNFFF